MNVTIHVTTENIDQGVTAHCAYCPVARAIRPLIKGGYAVSVDNEELTVSIWRDSFKRDLFARRLPWDVRLFIAHFDSGGKDWVDPFSFQLDIPDEYCTRTACAEAVIA